MQQILKNILLLDDDINFCEVLARGLSRHDFLVYVSHTIQDACNHIVEKDINYAVIDLRIGSESGLAAINKIISLQPKIKIVVLTGYASIATAVEAIKLGASDYLTKPTDIINIINALNSITGDTEVASTPMSIKRLEWEHLQKVLQEHDGNISAAARALNMHRRTLQRKLQKKPVKQ